MTHRLVLVHSPLVGSCTWQATADELRRRNIHAIVPTIAPSCCEGLGPFYPAIAQSVAEQVQFESPVVLVAHSGAGTLIPAVSDALAARGIEVEGAIFVDSVLPHPGRTWFDTVPVERGEQLRERAEDGLLPPWNEWFGETVLEKLIPDHDLRNRFIREVPILPLAYFEEKAPESVTWPPRYQAYVRISHAYLAEQALAEMRDIPVIEADLDHLAMLTQPVRVADLLETALAQFRDQPNLKIVL